MFNSAKEKRLKLVMKMEERRLEAERKHKENMMRMMFTMMNSAGQQMLMPYPTPPNHGLVMPMYVATNMHTNITTNMPTNITERTPIIDFFAKTDNDNIPTNLTTLLNMPHGSSGSFYHD